jgi:hypothetical protein
MHKTCPNCGGAHYGWQCSEIRAALFAPDPPAAPWADVALGRELCRMRWKDHDYFVTILAALTPAALLSYAASYQAFVRSHAPDSTLTITEVVQAWTRAMQRAAERKAAA